MGNSIGPAIVVKVEDIDGSLCNNDNSLVALSVASGPGVLNGNLTVAAVNGVATFSSVMLNTTGPYTLQATDGSLSAAISTSFTISTLPGDLALTSPASAVSVTWGGNYTIN